MMALEAASAVGRSACGSETRSDVGLVLARTRVTLENQPYLHFLLAKRDLGDDF